VEGQGSTQQPAPPQWSMTAPPKRRSKKLVIVAVLTVIIVAVIIAAALLLVPQGHGLWEPKAGDYIEYTYFGDVTGTMRITVDSVGWTTMDVTTSYNMTGMTPWDEHHTYSKNTDLGVGTDLNNPSEGYSLTRQGTATITTPYGDRPANHYSGTITEQGVTMSVEMWEWQGIMLEMDISYSGISSTIDLTSTNVDVIMHPQTTA
jgi:hypothetical protein